MNKAHKRNLIIMWICIIGLSITTVTGYGLIQQSYRGVSVLVSTGIICSIIYSLKIDDFKKALCLIIIPAYAILLYSWLVGGNSTAFEASYIALGMAACYFNPKIIKYFAIPYTTVTLILTLIDFRIISDFNLMEGLSKIIILIVTSSLIYIGTKFGEEKVNQVNETLKQIESHRITATNVTSKLNEEMKTVQPKHLK